MEASDLIYPYDVQTYTTRDISELEFPGADEEGFDSIKWVKAMEAEAHEKGAVAGAYNLGDAASAFMVRETRKQVIEECFGALRPIMDELAEQQAYGGDDWWITQVDAAYERLLNPPAPATDDEDDK